jgi:hypothetical protein
MKSPIPKTTCVSRLFIALNIGLGVFDDAIPAPSAGCRMNHGATTVTTPMKSAGHNVGDRAHDAPNVANSIEAKVTPIE